MSFDDVVVFRNEREARVRLELRCVAAKELASAQVLEPDMSCIILTDDHTGTDPGRREFGGHALVGLTYAAVIADVDVLTTFINNIDARLVRA